MKRLLLFLITVYCAAGALTSLEAAGTLTPVGAGYDPIRIVDHTVDVVINNGFAQTRVTQTFFNPNDRDLEAVYSFPVPKSASMSEVSITIGEKIINGEVLAKEKAKKVYESERDQGNESGLATKNGYQDFTFRVSPVKANKQAVIRFVYYQPLEIDTGIGRYVYPLEEGGTDEEAENFWTKNEKVEQSIAINVELKSAYPLSSVRSPRHTAVSVDDRLQQGYYRANYEMKNATLSKDFVFYYRFQDNLPGRVEIVPYKKQKDKPGTFMMVITPGLDLKPITRGADYIFVLDVSGSMHRKIHTLAEGVIKSIRKMSDRDRFRIIIFDDEAGELTGGWVNATTQNVAEWAQKVKALKSGGGTNLYDALSLCLNRIKDDDRATSVILVTDAVTNTGIVSPKAFHKLMKKYDIRIFGFVMGNSANWPLMRTICNASGGFYAGVSNSDDIVGQIMKAKSKITHECLHDASLKIGGVKTYAMTDRLIGKVYNGQQLVFFGKYDKAGKATVTLKARLTGQDKVYKTTFDFPEVDNDNPEIERLWALNQVEMTEDLMNSGLMPVKEGEQVVRDLGVTYQLVTDETSMVVLTDQAFEKYGIERRNLLRTAEEHQAQSRRSGYRARNYRVDKKNRMFSRSAPSFGGGGGAIDPFWGLIVLVLALCTMITVIRKGKYGKNKQGS